MCDSLNLMCHVTYSCAGGRDVGVVLVAMCYVSTYWRVCKHVLTVHVTHSCAGGGRQSASLRYLVAAVRQGYPALCALDQLALRNVVLYMCVCVCVLCVCVHMCVCVCVRAYVYVCA